ncbi:SpoIIIAH-like family protein [Clostridium swellfunianum]|uniref:SpoIIIAH-like family protein n=1 Tax=Clostridium swellfunianum TaxID=1367462 RepID=UPI00202E8ABB|nr:SpoIIIAH-like family protein [Clostridium swellfunianum]MCM0647690.1 SpoIIIAH-like family protein [Clostridium swellfunianum]
MKIKLQFNKIKSSLIIVLIVLASANLLSIYYIHHVKSKAKESFFVQQRLLRAQEYSKSFNTYKAIIDDKNISQENRQAVLEKYKSLSDAAEAELKIESLLKSKGFTDSFVSIAPKRAASVVIRYDNGKLGDREIKIIKETMLRFTDIRDIEVIQRD